MMRRIVDKALIPLFLAGTDKQRLPKPTSHNLKLVYDYNLLFNAIIVASEGNKNLIFTKEDITWTNNWILDEEFGPLR